MSSSSSSNGSQAAKSSSNLSVEKLTEENYKTWRMKLITWMKKEDLMKVINLGEKDPPAKTLMDVRAGAAITLNITDNILYIIEECQSASTMWIAI